MDKDDLRREIAGKKRAMGEDEILRASQELAGQLLVHPLYREAKTLYVYLSYNQEVRTDGIIRQARKDGKRIAVPKVFGKELRFFYLDEDTRLETGSFGIAEPVDGQEADDRTALVLLPGLAFDRDGHRIGYGGGYYDRFLAAQPLHPTIALCYAFQMLDHVPAQAHDIPADVVLVSE